MNMLSKADSLKAAVGEEIRSKAIMTLEGTHLEVYHSSLQAAIAAGMCMGTVGSLHSLAVGLKLSLSKMVYTCAHVHIHAKHVREKEVSNHLYRRTQFL